MAPHDALVGSKSMHWAKLESKAILAKDKCPLEFLKADIMRENPSHGDNQARTSYSEVINDSLTISVPLFRPRGIDKRHR